MSNNRQGLNHVKDEVTKFHKAFGHKVSETPAPMDTDLALHRAKYKVEEIVEFLYATAKGDVEEFQFLVTELIISLFHAENKLIDKGEEINSVLVAQADALIDESYFLGGDFAILGIDPQPLFDIVQEANMSKLWPDGKPRYDESNGNKVVKPEGWVAPEPKLKAEIERQLNK